MPKHDNPRRDRDDDNDEKHHRRRHPGEEERGPRGEHAIFVDLVQRRLGGGATPTAEAYAQAMQQWQQLPGAVQFAAVPAFPKPDPDTPPTAPEPTKNTEDPA